MRYVHWRLYGERGLAGAQAAIWVLGETVTVEYAGDTLAQFQADLEPDGRHIRQVTDARLFETRHPSPQPLLPALGTMDWRPAIRLPAARPARRRRNLPVGQLALLPVATRS